MKRLKKAGWLAVLFFIVGSAAACGGKTDLAAPGQPAEKQAESVEANGQGRNAGKILRVGTTARSIPFSYQNEETQQLDGFEVEFINLIGKQLGYEVEWTVTDFSGLMGMIEADKIDTIANQVVATEERKQKYLFSTPYLYSGSRLVVRADDESIRSLEDLKGKKIAAGLGSNNEVFLQEYEKEHAIGMSIVAYEDTSGIMYDIANGRVDTYLLDQGAGLVRIKKSELPLKFSGEPVDSHEIA